MTVLDIITGALLDLGVLAAGETPDAADSSFGLLRLNRLMGQWRTEGLSVYTLTRTTWTITSGTGSYSVGSGATVNVVRPVSPQSIVRVTVQDTATSPTLELPNLTPLTEDAYAQIPQKSLTANYPSSWYYNPTWTTGTLTFWPVPTSTTLQGVLYAPALISDFAAITTSFSLPDGYQRFIETALALEMSPSYGVPPSPLLMQAAHDSRAAVMRQNQRQADMSVDPGALMHHDRGSWSALAGP